MKNTFLRISLFSLVILVSSAFIISCGEAQSSTGTTGNVADSTQPFIKNVNAAEFKQLRDSGDITLDVRTPGEVAQGHLEGASVINIYDPEFKNKINLMDKNKEIYVYCKAGGRSSSAAEILLENGFTKVYNLDGGIMAWERAGYSTVQSEGAADENIQTMTLVDFKEILNTDKPVLIDFHTQWCSPCRKMAPVVDEIAKEYEGKAIVLRVDVDKSKEIGEKYEIQGVPVFILFKNGESVWRHTGALSKEAITAEIEKVM